MADEKNHAAPATHAQPSRKGKKAWRKNVDISEVQTGLEDVREEIIKGGVIAEKEADQLFATDLQGDAEIEKAQKGKKLLKADEILAQRSAVPGIPQHRKRKAEETLSTGKRQKNGNYVSHKELQRLKGVADGANVGLIVDGGATHDPWAETAPVQQPEYSFLEPPKEKRAPKTLKQAPVPLTATGKPLAHVRKPDAGKSYNPLVGDWSALLEREGEAAVEAEKARLAAEAEAAERERRAEEEAAKVEAAEKDEYATDYESAWESEWDGIQSEAEEAHTAKQKSRKTPREQNKAKARKEREARERWELKQKEREKQERQIKQIAKELSEKDKKRRLGTQLQRQSEHVSSDSDENDGESKLQKRRFGKVQIPEAPLEVTLPEDLEDSLRRLKPEGNLLTDRYRNLLINGKLEVRKPVGQVKQKQTFRTEKWTYKDFKVPK